MVPALDEHGPADLNNRAGPYCFFRNILDYYSLPPYSLFTTERKSYIESELQRIHLPGIHSPDIVQRHIVENGGDDSEAGVRRHRSRSAKVFQWGSGITISIYERTPIPRICDFRENPRLSDTSSFQVLWPLFLWKTWGLRPSPSAYIRHAFRAMLPCAVAHSPSPSRRSESLQNISIAVITIGEIASYWLVFGVPTKACCHDEGAGEKNSGRVQGIYRSI